MPIKLLFQLSWRNLWRQRRRNGILLVAIGLAVTGVFLMNTVMRGMQAEMVDAVIDNLTGHVKVLQPGYRDDPGIERGFDVDDDWREAIDETILEGWATRVVVPAVIMSERETRGIQLVGIRPDNEEISFLGEAEFEGERLSGPDDRRLVIGAELASLLETAIGRRLVLVTQGADGKNRETGYRIAGTFDADGTGLEKTYVFTGEQALQSVLSTGVVTELSFRLKEEATSPDLIAALIGIFTGLDVMTWRELHPHTAEIVTFADAAIFIYFLVIMGALVFGLVNALVTAVMERVRELGMLRALGMRPRAVIVQVVVESSLIMASGVALGLLLGFGLFQFFADGIDLSGFSESLEMLGARSIFVPVVRFDDVVIVLGMSLGLGIVASLYPAWRAVKLKPLDALRR